MKKFNETISKKKVAFTFGRMNPITRGHEESVHFLLSLAKNENIDAKIFLSRSNDKEKNPLTYEQKVKYLKLCIPDSTECIVDIPEVKTPFQAIEYLIDQKYTDVIMIVGSDRVKEFQESVPKYINHPDPNKNLQLDSFVVLSSGERIDGISGTDLRQYVRDNNYGKFVESIPDKISSKEATELFQILRSSLVADGSGEEISINKNVKRFKDFVK